MRISIESQEKIDPIILPEGIEGNVTEIPLEGVDGTLVVVIIEIVAGVTGIVANSIVIGQFIDSIIKKNKNAKIKIYEETIAADASTEGVIKTIEEIAKNRPN